MDAGFPIIRRFIFAHLLRNGFAIELVVPVRIEHKQLSARLQNLQAFTIGGNRVRQRPRNVARHNQVEGCLGEAQAFGVHMEHHSVNAALFGIRTCARQHVIGGIDAIRLGAFCTKRAGKEPRAAAQIEDGFPFKGAPRQARNQGDPLRRTGICQLFVYVLIVVIRIRPGE